MKLSDLRGSFKMGLRFEQIDEQLKNLCDEWDSKPYYLIVLY